MPDNSKTGYRSWSEGDIEELYSLVSTIWIALRPKIQIEVHIQSGSDEFEHDIAFMTPNCHDHEHRTDIIDRFLQCLHTLKDLDKFQGWVWIHLSGATSIKTSIQLMFNEWIPEHQWPSNHEHLAARTDLKERLLGAGMTSENIDTILAN